MIEFVSVRYNEKINCGYSIKQRTTQLTNEKTLTTN